MTYDKYVFAASALALGLVATACGGSSDSGSKTVTETVSASTTATTTAASRTTSSSASSSASESSSASASASGDLPSLIPAPANTQRTDGPKSVQSGGTQLHFLVNGSPADVMNAYKSDLEGKGWTVTVERSDGGGGGGGATYTGTNGGAYGVFVGGGYGNTTDVNSCAWPSKPSNTNCGRD
jgi:hypothetical protein